MAKMIRAFLDNLLSDALHGAPPVRLSAICLITLIEFSILFVLAYLTVKSLILHELP